MENTVSGGTAKKKAGRPAVKAAAQPDAAAGSPEAVMAPEAAQVRKKSPGVLAKVDPNELVELRSCCDGRLEYVSRAGYSATWGEYGNIQLIPVSEIITMRNEQPSFFINHWVYPVSDNADRVIQALQLERYYNKMDGIRDIDEIFNYTADEIVSIVKSAPARTRENVARRAARLVEEHAIDSYEIIDAVERATGFTIRERD